MTKISYLAGIGADERKQRGELIPSQPFIPYSHMTKGQLRLALLREQMKMLAAFYPEDKKWQKGVSMIDNSLYRGIHGLGARQVGSIDNALQPLAAAIKRAAVETKPANNRKVHSYTSSVGNRQSPNNPILTGALIEQLDCNEMIPGYALEEPTDDMISYGVDPFDMWLETPQGQEYLACISENNTRGTLNTHLEKSSHHLLYEFVKNASSENGVVAAKTLYHRTGTDLTSQASKLDRDMIRLWERNGVMRQNAKEGAGVLQPEQSIEVLRANAGEPIPGVGDFGITALIGIITAVTAAVSAAAQLVSALKGTDNQTAALWQQLQGIGTPTFGPEGVDFTGSGGPGPGNEGEGNGDGDDSGNKDITPLLLIGGGLLVASEIL
jgi:hypothetical protein